MILNPEKKLLGRRNFLKAAATIPAVGVVGYQATTLGPVKAGIIGTGMQGRILITCMDPKYLYLIASCDLRPDNRILGHELIKKPGLGHHPNPALYENVDEMLANPEIEAVVIATPLHTHAPLALKALQAGKHVFVEKAMAYSEDLCRQMIQLAQQKGLMLQVGHQRFFNPLYWDAYKMIKEGLLGNVYHIRALWHRNTDWNYWTHFQNEDTPELQQKLLATDPTPLGYPDHQHWVNWRWYSEYSHGLWTELCSHQLAITNWFFESMPNAVYAIADKAKTAEDLRDLYLKYKGEYDTMKKFNAAPTATFEEYLKAKQVYGADDRTIADHIFAIFEYPNNRTVSYSSIQSSSVDQYYEEIMGTRGTIILSNENESYLFWEPEWDEEKAKKAVDDEKSTSVEVVAEDESASAFAAHVSSEAKGSGGASDMTPYEPYTLELRGFAHSIRTGAPNLCDGTRAMQALIPILKGMESAQKRTRLEIQPLTVA